MGWRGPSGLFGHVFGGISARSPVSDKGAATVGAPHGRSAFLAPPIFCNRLPALVLSSLAQVERIEPASRLP